MTTFDLIRHGQTDWEDCRDRGLKGFRTDLTPLTKTGVAQIENTALDERLQQAKLILSSPYIRALESAAILSRVTRIPLKLEFDLHEWMPDTNGNDSSEAEVWALAKEFEAHHGAYPTSETKRWESLDHLKTRVANVLEKYTNLEHVIVVCHEMMIWSITGIRDVAYGQIIEDEWLAAQFVTV
jgi:broad specificity phosphatase PhoE